MSCSSRAIRARSATTASRRSISASSAVCSARSRAVSAACRWLRTTTPVTAGTNDTMPVRTPISSAHGSRYQASDATDTATVTSPVVTGSRRAEAGGPYTTAAYTRSVNIRIVAMLPRVNWSATTATVPASSAVRGRTRRRSSSDAVTSSGGRTAHGASRTAWRAPWLNTPSDHSRRPPARPAEARRTSSRWGRNGVTVPSNTPAGSAASPSGPSGDYIEGCSTVSSSATTPGARRGGRLGTWLSH